MKNWKKCYCLFAVLTTIAVIILIAALHGYEIADWTISSWIGGIFIVVAVYVCSKCRMENTDNR